MGVVCRIVAIATHVAPAARWVHDWGCGDRVGRRARVRRRTGTVIVAVDRHRCTARPFVEEAVLSRRRGGRELTVGDDGVESSPVDGLAARPPSLAQPIVGRRERRGRHHCGRLLVGGAPSRRTLLAPRVWAVDELHAHDLLPSLNMVAEPSQGRKRRGRSRSWPLRSEPCLLGLRGLDDQDAVVLLVLVFLCRLLGHP